MDTYLVLATILTYFVVCVQSQGSLTFKLADAPELYKDFVKRYKRTFQSEYDYNKRYVNFVNTLRNINSINSQINTPMKVLPNQYADYSDDERRAYLRKTVTHIDPELRTILRMKDNPPIGKIAGKKEKQSEGPLRMRHGIRSYGKK